MALRGKIPMSEGLYIGATKNGGRAILTVHGNGSGSDYYVAYKDAQATHDMADALRKYSLYKFVSSVVWVPIPDPAELQRIPSPDLLAALERLAEAAIRFAAEHKRFHGGEGYGFEVNATQKALLEVVAEMQGAALDAVRASR